MMFHANAFRGRETHNHATSFVVTSPQLYLQSVCRLAPRARVAGDDGEPRPVELSQQRHDRLGDLRVARYRPREGRVLRGAVGDFGVAAFLQAKRTSVNGIR